MNFLRLNVPRGWAAVAATFAGVSGAYYSFFYNKSKDGYSLEKDLSGKTFVVLGATSGIGLETARELAIRKAKVIMACRNNRKCIETRRNLVISTKNTDIYCRRLDLEDFDSVREFAVNLWKGKSKVDRIDGIVFNAATVEANRLVNNNKIERMIATNYFGSFLLTALLYDRLLMQKSPVRLVFLNSSTINKYEIDLDDLNATDLKKWQKQPETTKKEVFYQSKLALAIFVKALADKIKDTNLSAIMVDPGIVKTGVFYRLENPDKRYFPVRWYKKVKRWLYGSIVANSLSQATKPVLYAVADEAMENKNGVFIDTIRTELPWHNASLDPRTAERLWMISAKWTNAAEQLQLFERRMIEPEAAVIPKIPVKNEEQSKSSKSGKKTWNLWFW